MLAGGFLFGAVGGGVLSALGLTLSACLVCFAGRRFLAGPIEKALNCRHTGVLRALTNDAFSYLMALRLLPGMPAWLTNLFPVPLPVRLRTVLMATSLGVLPVCLVFATIGNGVALLGAEHQPLSAQMILQPRYVAPLLGLAVLVLLPPLIRKRPRLRVGDAPRRAVRHRSARASPPRGVSEARARFHLIIRPRPGHVRGGLSSGMT